MTDRQVPGWVRVAGLDVPVVLVDGLDGFGEYDGDRRLIRLRAGMSSAVTASTLLHEVLHAVADAHGIRLGEQAVRAIESGLVAALRADPAGARGWLEGLLVGAGPGLWPGADPLRS